MEDVDDSSCRSLQDDVDPIEIATQGGDLPVDTHFPVALRNAKVAVGSAVDGACSPSKYCTRESSDVEGTTELLSVSCTQVLSGLSEGTHTIELMARYN